MKQKQIVCLSSTPWLPAPSRTQQLMARLKNAQVLFFEPPGPGHRRPGRQVRPGLTVYTLPKIPDVEERHYRLFRLGQRRLARFIASKLDRHRFREPALWCSTPWAVHLLEDLPFQGLIYDCHQDWSRLPIRWESDLALEADVIFAASPGLADHLSPCSDNIALLPNGVNHPMFTRSNLECPSELRRLRGPVFGYIGTLWRDLDLTPALHCARSMPDASFVFLGAQRENPTIPALKSLPNVHFLDYRLPVDVPDYLDRFDVCLNFLRLRNPGSDVISPRIYEYLATGKPIVSMLFPDQIEDFPDVVYGAHTAREFAQLCRRALAEIGDWARNRRREYGAAASWSQRAKEVNRILDTIGLFA